MIGKGLMKEAMTGASYDRWMVKETGWKIMGRFVYNFCFHFPVATIAWTLWVRRSNHCTTKAYYCYTQMYSCPRIPNSSPGLFLSKERVFVAHSTVNSTVKWAHVNFKAPVGNYALVEFPASSTSDFHFWVFFTRINSDDQSFGLRTYWIALEAVRLY